MRLDTSGFTVIIEFPGRRWLARAMRLRQNLPCLGDPVFLLVLGEGGGFPCPPSATRAVAEGFFLFPSCRARTEMGIIKRELPLEPVRILP